jgi:hypothetical protein
MRFLPASIFLIERLLLLLLFLLFLVFSTAMVANECSGDSHGSCVVNPSSTHRTMWQSFSKGSETSADPAPVGTKTPKSGASSSKSKGFLFGKISTPKEALLKKKKKKKKEAEKIKASEMMKHAGMDLGVFGDLPGWEHPDLLGEKMLNQRHKQAESNLKTVTDRKERRRHQNKASGSSSSFENQLSSSLSVEESVLLEVADNDDESCLSRRSKTQTKACESIDHKTADDNDELPACNSAPEPIALVLSSPRRRMNVMLPHLESPAKMDEGFGFKPEEGFHAKMHKSLDLMDVFDVSSDDEDEDGDGGASQGNHELPKALDKNLHEDEGSSKRLLHQEFNICTPERVQTDVPLPPLRVGNKDEISLPGFPLQTPNSTKEICPTHDVTPECLNGNSRTCRPPQHNAERKQKSSSIDNFTIRSGEHLLPPRNPRRRAGFTSSMNKSLDLLDVFHTSEDSNSLNVSECSEEEINLLGEPTSVSAGEGTRSGANIALPLKSLSHAPLPGISEDNEECILAAASPLTFQQKRNTTSHEIPGSGYERFYGSQPLNTTTGATPLDEEFNTSPSPRRLVGRHQSAVGHQSLSSFNMPQPPRSPRRESTGILYRSTSDFSATEETKSRQTGLSRLELRELSKNIRQRRTFRPQLEKEPDDLQESQATEVQFEKQNTSSGHKSTFFNEVKEQEIIAMALERSIRDF